MKIYLALLFLFLHTVKTCWFAKDINSTACKSALEVSVEGTTSMKKLYLFNENKHLNLKKDTFKRTPNLEELTVSFVDSMEEGTFNGLNNLDKLIIWKSEIEEVTLGSHPLLRHIQIFKTKVKRIQPGFFSNLPDIRHVDFRNNSISEVKKGTFDNTTIYKLYLGNNGLVKIEDKSFENMKDLIYLSLHSNLLTSFTTERYLGYSTSLLQLWLDKNKLSKITKDMFTTVPQLTNLYLELNQIESIEPESFHFIPYLEFLDISNNKLYQIPPYIFLPSGMSKLYYISMQNNRLTFLNKDLFNRIPNLEYITYGGNPFQCPCSQLLDNLIKKKNVKRVCDDEYLKGERPSCVFDSVNSQECTNNAFTDELYEIYYGALTDYSFLELKCDTTKGVANAFLNNVEDV